jgi:hypothetical protein
LRWTTTFRDGHNKIASTPSKSKNQRAGIGSDYVREQLVRWIDANLGVQSRGGALHPVRDDMEAELSRFRAKRDAYLGFRNAARHRKRRIIAVSTSPYEGKYETFGFGTDESIYSVWHNNMIWR